ncbi:prolyl oligopeptidase family serine peptidase [Alteromonas sp. 1_MG-2023]|uniref:S9 family peptidase n=1 Tax=Alteromonas sp. 1_MG-2023 TaxID=3062669 RepID=UPI0026E3250C|nr:prolyl oligopeptidase family serine peptidase [Alteromonas sp. 1_MG-2023]MDO6569141.1 prolyl oligopeptidase family serine peptidase [Alteromonas sp. 1_MG-2023]
MQKFSSLVLASSITLLLSGCATTDSTTDSSTVPNTSSSSSKTDTTSSNTAQSRVNNSANSYTPTPDVEKSTAAYSQNGEITLKQIMADPKWLGRAPSRMRWSVDGSHIVYERKQINGDLNDVYIASIDTPSKSTHAPLAQLQRYKYDEKVTRDDGVIAYRFKDSVYVQFTNDEIVQLTRGGSFLSSLSFMTDGRLMALSGSSAIAINLSNGSREELVSWSFSDEPEAVAPAKDYIAEEQQSLIQYIAKKRHASESKAKADDELAANNTSVAPDTFYFDKTHKLVGVSVSPKGDYAIIATTPDKPTRDDSDIMPHYIQEDSRIASKPVRRKVADAEPINHHLWLLNLSNGEKSPLNYFSLPGYNDDVLADVKTENAKAKGETYDVNRLPRAITLLSSWNWQQPSISWHKDGEQVAVMLEAWDNKDRWIATVDTGKQRLVNQHRLHDDAWVNYRFNSFGWFNNSETLYYQSEHSGYSHLYTQVPGQAPKALTKGTYITDSPTLSKDDMWMYFTANSKHPGIFEVYRVKTTGGEVEALTDLNGLTEYELSPDNTTLVLSHGKVTRPPELYVKAVDSKEAATKITDTVSEAFTAMPWAVPNVVAIPSSHTDAPIYARVYLPKDYQADKPLKAVVFNHGAGYLQNAHLGWSLYFREYMFNSMLVQQGYVVLDMDYRASAGYGRDWRTAIYRNMGTPEVQDLRDGVNWLVENANVDRNRIGTYGGSYGGFLTFMSMFNAPDLFAAGAALRPVTDWAHYNIGYTSNILNTPDVDPIAYERSSPIYFAEGLEKPLLINAPMVDDNVFFHDTVRLVQRLIELEKEDFETAIYPVEPHGFVQPSSWLDEYRRIYKLFEENL